VLLVHGAGVRANIFNAPLPTSFVRYLVERGHDVWLENWRASIDLPRNAWTLDQAAVHDHPAAVRTLCERSGVQRCAAVIHCQGSSSFTMAALAGLLPQVDLIVSNAVSLHVVVPEAARRKSLYLLPIVAALTDYLDPRRAGGGTAELLPADAPLHPARQSRQQRRVPGNPGGSGSAAAADRCAIRAADRRAQRLLHAGEPAAQF
jgi:hypothetical protein